ncbi:non-ribosomal peptide synthetase [Catenulispora rubra]|uniref:non-ribosomal peptide synthetase n=1 Tax=Catenulispora rubra TaxID=280293 RepID=UPI00189284EC|nr:non-ribosomal peptide synthetase [Catenulispora rubra]
MTTPESLAEVLIRRGAEQPDREALTFLGDDGNAVELTYAELDARARAVAAVLADTCSVGDRALLLYPPGPEYVAGFFGCLYAGVIAVPAYPPLDARQAARLTGIAADATPAAVLTEAAFLDLARDLLEPVLRETGVQASWLATDTVATVDDPSRVRHNSERIAFLQYTSGSTGQPKGVVVTHANLMHNSGFIRDRFGHSESSRGVIWLPPYHDMGLIGGILQPVFAGFPVTLMSPLSFLRDPLRWLRAVSDYGATTSGGPNFAYDLAVRKTTSAQRESLDLSRWTVAFTGAEQVRPATLDAFAEAFGPAGFRRRAYFPCYGLAEATLMVTGVHFEADPEVTAFATDELATGRAVPVEAGGAGRLMVSCGTPPADATVAVIDPESGSPVAEGTVGEIIVSGPSVAAGYWGGRDAEVFADGRVRTGDLGFLHAGGLYVTGRRKDLIIVRGRNVAPDDVELAAGRAHSALRPGCGAAIAVEAGAEEQLAVVHEVQGPKPLPLAEIAAAVRTAVLGEQGVAVSRVVLLGKGGLPKTSSGKVRRSECRRALAAGELSVLFDDGAEPEPGDISSATDDVLRELAAEVLGVAKEELGSDVSLAAFGLESVKAAELAVLAEAAGLRLSLPELMSGADLRTLAGSAIAITAGQTVEPTDALTEGERAMWFLHRLAPDSTAYHLGHAVEIAGPFSATRFGEALNSVVGRHAALRTRFGLRDGEPYRIVGEPSVDWASIAFDADVDTAIQGLIDEPFDLESGPLWRIRHWQLDDERHILALAVHHITADLWSLTALVRELLGTSRPSNGSAPAVADPTMAAAVHSERTYLATPEARQALDRWRDRLADLPESLDLPTDRPRPAVQSFRGARHHFDLPSETARAVEALAAAERVSPYAVLLTAYAWLLHAYTGASDLVVGAPAPGRLTADTADVLGLAVNVVPVRCGLTSGATFLETIRHVASRLREALAGQRIPLPRLVEIAHPDRDPGRSPLFQTLFALQQAPAGDALAAFLLEAGSAEIGDLRLTSLPVATTGAQLDLSLEIVRTAETMRCGLTYDTALWDADTAVRFSDHFTTLLAAAVADPEVTAERIDLRSPAEQADWNSPRVSVPDELIQEAVDRHADRTPHAIAIRDGERDISYARLKRWSDSLANRLHQLGIGPEDRVGLVADRSAEFTAAALAVLKTGAAYVPLDTDHPTARLVALAEDAGISLLIGSEAHAAELARATGGATPVMDPAEPAVGLEAPPNTGHPDNAAYVMYTSGSTGEPKGVCVTHAGVVNLLDELACEAGDVCAWWTSGGFDVSVFEIFGALRAGATADVVPAEVRPHAAGYVDWLAERGITHAYVPPFALAALEERISRLTLRRLIVSVEPTPEPLLRRIAAGRPGLSVVNGYGPTEATIFATFHHLDPDGTGSGMVPIGRAVQNCPARVLDASGRSVPLSVPGELFIGGVGLARGYLGRPGATAEAFVPDPFADQSGARMYRTGDIVRYRPDGYLRFLGRRDQQVKLRGVRIELGEVQAALTRQPGVASALAVVRQIGGQPVLIGYVVAATPEHAATSRNGVRAGTDALAAPNPAELRARLRAVLPAPMVPSAVVVLDAWPVTVNGKLDRRALPLPEAVRASAFEPPADDRERTVADIIGKLLGGRRIGRHDDFFDLGGHSLLAAQAALQIGGALGLDVPVVALFSHPTVAGLSEALAATATPFAPITALPRSHDDPADLAARVAGLPDDIVQLLTGLLTDEVSGA